MHLFFDTKPLWNTVDFTECAGLNESEIVSTIVAQLHQISLPFDRVHREVISTVSIKEQNQ